MLRFVHTADWHLGKRLLGHSLLEDQAYALSELEAVCKSESADALVIAGDIYDRTVPSVDAVELFDAFLSRITSRLGIPVIAISGNHDSVERLGFGAALFERAGIHVRTRLARRIEPIGVTSRRGNHHALFYALPYLEPELGRLELDDASIKGHDAAVRAALSAVHKDRRDRAEKNAVLVAHLFCVGGVECPDSERPLAARREIAEDAAPEDVGGAGYVHPRSLGKFAYVALGHLHRAQRVAGRDHVRYSGSLMQYSVPEHDDEKSVTVVDLEDGVATSRTVPLPRKRRVVVIEGTFEELLRAREHAQHADDYVAARYSDETFVLHAAERLRERFPRLLEAVPVRLIAARDALAPERRTDSPRALLRAFLSYVDATFPLEDRHVERFEHAYDRATQEAATEREPRSSPPPLQEELS